VIQFCMQTANMLERRRLRRISTALVLPLLALLQEARAQEAQSVPTALHWSFAAVFGSGYYRIGDNDIFVVRVPLGGELAEFQEGRARLYWTLPVSAGSVQFDEFFDEGTLPTRMGLVTALPGLRLDYQLNPQWRVSPSLFLGYGWARDASNATLFGAGVSGVRSFSMADAQLSLGVAGDYYSYSASDDGQDGMIRLGAGLDLVLPLALALDERQVYFKGYALYYRYQADLAAPFYSRLDTLPRREMLYEWTIAAAFGFREPMRVFGLELDRIGVALSGTDLDEAFAIKLVASFPF